MIVHWIANPTRFLKSMPDAGVNRGVQEMCRAFEISDQSAGPASACLEVHFAPDHGAKRVIDV
jgi:hypothetical protein